MKCLVTGAAGFIGSHLSEELIRQGHAVEGLDCFTDYYAKRIKLANLAGLRRTDAFEFVEGDLSKMNFSRLLRGVECVFHLAAQAGVRSSWGKSFSSYVRDNVVATQRLLEAAQGNSIKKFVYASSSSIYGDSESLPTREDATPKPVSPYGVTKLTGEGLCYVYNRNLSVPTVVLRYFTVYGPRQRPDMAFNKFIARIAAGKEIEVYGDGEQTRDFTFVADTVAATILALRATPGAVYNVGTGSSTSVNEVISTIESILGKKAKVRRKEQAAGDVRATSADIDLITRELRYHPRTSLVEGLKKQITFQLG